jgi:hypothetical protein
MQGLFCELLLYTAKAQSKAEVLRPVKIFIKALHRIVIVLSSNLPPLFNYVIGNQFLLFSLSLLMHIALALS